MDSQSPVGELPDLSPMSNDFTLEDLDLDLDFDFDFDCLDDPNPQQPSAGALDSSPTAAQYQIVQPCHISSLGNNGFTSQPLQSGGNNVGPNHHQAPFSRTVKNQYKPYSVEDEIKLLHAVAIHGQKWKRIANMFRDRSEEQLKQKWKHVMQKACTTMAGTEMDKNKKCFYIFAAFVHVNVVKESYIYKEKFQKWFEIMEGDDGKIKANAKAWFREVKKCAKFTSAELNQARLYMFG